MKESKYKVNLKTEERVKLEEMIRKGIHPARQLIRANILLELDNLNYYDAILSEIKPTREAIARRCKTSAYTVNVVSKQYINEGLEATLRRKKRKNPPIEPIVTGDKEARIIALTCGAPPKGYKRWTLRLLENKVVELGIMEKVSDTTIFRVLKKQN